MRKSREDFKFAYILCRIFYYDHSPCNYHRNTAQREEPRYKPLSAPKKASKKWNRAASDVPLGQSLTMVNISMEYLQSVTEKIAGAGCSDPVQ